MKLKAAESLLGARHHLTGGFEAALHHAPRIASPLRNILPIKQHNRVRRPNREWQSGTRIDTLRRSSLQAEPPFRMLSVDDDPGIRDLVKRALALARLTPDGAKDPFEALELSGQQRYDLFILDLNMPGLSGFELCEKLRAAAAYKKTPVIFVTGSDNFESRVRSADSGGNDFIGKPFLPRELAVKALIHLLPRPIELSSK